MGGLKRFLHLEKRRPERGPDEDGSGRSDRFARIDKASARTDVSPETGAQVQRFEKQITEPPPSLNPVGTQEQPFLRCQFCNADSSRYAQRCERCDADLTTPEQRVFNAQLWSARLAERQVEQEQLEQARFRSEEASHQQQAALKKGHQAMGEYLAERERTRVLRDLGGSEFDFLHDPRVRRVALGVIGLAAVALFLIPRTRGWGFVLSVVLGLLFGRRGRGRWRW